MLLTEIIAVYCDSHTTCMNAMCGQTAKYLECASVYGAVNVKNQTASVAGLSVNDKLARI